MKKKEKASMKQIRTHSLLVTIVGSGSLQSKKNFNNFCILQDIHTRLAPFKSAQKPAFGDIYFHWIAAWEHMQPKIIILAYGSIMTISKYLIYKEF